MNALDFMIKFSTIYILIVVCSVNVTAQNKETIVVNGFMDSWHHAAAVGDEMIFFGSMSENGIYIGTDKSERWNKKEMEVWSKKYFDLDSAWDFTPIERDIHFSADGQYSWFNETLETWMGVCRGSGTLHKEDGHWLIDQYHLSVTVPNEIIQSFIELVGAPKKQRK